MSDTNDPESNSDGPDDDANTVPVADQEKHDRLAKEQNILIAGQYLSYGRSTTLSPFEVQTTPLSSINQNCVMYNNHTTLIINPAATLVPDLVQHQNQLVRLKTTNPLRPQCRRRKWAQIAHIVEGNIS